MKQNSCTKKQFVIYLVVTFLAGYIIQVLACIFAKKGVTVGYTILNCVVMYTPFLGMVIANKSLRGLGWKPEFKGKIKYYIVAWIGPCIFMVLGAVLFFLTFPDAFDKTGMYIKQTLQATVDDNWQEVYGQMVSAGIGPVGYVLISLIQVVTYAPLINACFALGEEVGWRGFMYPYLKERLGSSKGRIIGGVIWGIWHWPLIILVGYEYGTDYFGAPFAGPVAFCLITVVLGIVLDYVYDKTKCIFAPAIAHGAINAAAGVPLLLFNPECTKYTIFGPCNVGIISIIPMMIFAIIILIRDKKQKN